MSGAVGLPHLGALPRLLENMKQATRFEVRGKLHVCSQALSSGYKSGGLG